MTGLYVAAFILALVALLLWWAYRAGKDAVRAGDAEKGLDNANEARRIDEAVDDMSDSKLDDKLRGDS